MRGHWIGECSRPLFKRMFEHNRLNTSSVYNHITQCNTHKEKLHMKFGIAPTAGEKRKFIEECFTILSSNNADYFKRTRIEEVAITLFKPSLNKQSDFDNKVTIIK